MTRSNTDELIYYVVRKAILIVLDDLYSRLTPTVNDEYLYFDHCTIVYM